MNRKSFLYLLLFPLMLSCSEEDPLPGGSQLMLNPNLSLYPDSVFPWTPETTNRIESGVSREVFFSGNRSLYLENQDSLIANSASWTQTYTGPMPAEGSTLELAAFVKGENIRDLTLGGRIFIAFKVFSDSQEGSAYAVFDF